ncbi:isopentenyl-diphosphate Delta-isomerase [Chitinophaga sancti]|uniref:Isopentenyl-diphosphate delta-isomerase n=1 Tax=Chitinophaga sancti TaxID=1004 RepID=A0A1K1MS90_9BACT|nr:isopentenyl-diphosphate Delta-isomerase [Chitinophaga sancti]WQD62939.1 isopentenyl-diphosphate Delta-isomerase [Chitinophaga sancti]WQG91436.1 isopentenyl-diphosphate Delta-isomerase [Chitinophaga sancti]SFW26058.1 isopentenyl-diphosphate delta-isomerase [Chitinophaga sancti]
MEAQVILVNEKDEVTGVMEKMEAHRKGLLHRAFSVFILNDAGEMLLHQRALDKYHSGGLWTNACCSHPLPGETVAQAAHRRLFEEMGFDCPLSEVFQFTYRTDFENGLIEHEYDHVLMGIYNGTINPNPQEVNDYRFIPVETITRLLQEQPAQFTSWFKLAFPKLIEHLGK